MKKDRIYRPDPAREYWFDEGCHILELLNSATDPDVSIARARVAPGSRTRWHRLHGVTERYLILEGTGLVEVGDLEPARVNQGDLVLIPANSRQRIENTGDEDLVFYAICSPRFTTAVYEDCEEADTPDD